MSVITFSATWKCQRRDPWTFSVHWHLRSAFKWHAKILSFQCLHLPRSLALSPSLSLPLSSSIRLSLKLTLHFLHEWAWLPLGNSHFQFHATMRHSGHCGAGAKHCSAGACWERDVNITHYADLVVVFTPMVTFSEQHEWPFTTTLGKRTLPSEGKILQTSVREVHIKMLVNPGI